ncbi:hypothetical protein SAMD00019534_067400 [Acytostelium subglobosum LB1]|uniref:hypothetical protein n=1 Tax=Acytostelium subglobosum LB1 TaxID=1410327 RepID=UPI0006451A4D|nr:hypothetical protein SAMD00019534_067400 [Acytostelium subglobosum LB1]GAM23565.1 hypothetical protein SAMD00019534_067400 [Acytostelium subglobosum LB1]|eukprot:XP_012753306.1 hypothetical protein SAMD00019534_067400 [Acytostelium subglobosum LB1]
MSTTSTSEITPTETTTPTTEPTTTKKDKKSSKGRVVIVGGGYGGIIAARKLEKDNFDVTVVEKKHVFFINTGSLRCIVEPEVSRKCFIPYAGMLKRGRFVHGLAINVSPTRVLMDSGEELPFDFLIIATGTNNLSPFKSPLDVSYAYQYFTDIKETIRQAQKVMIVGGGAVGVELAGEIATDFKGKCVQLVHNSDRLVAPQVNDKFTKKMNKKLVDMGVKLMFNTSIVVPDHVQEHLRQQSYFGYELEMKTFPTDSEYGNIEADLVFWCIGNKINNEPMAEHFGDAIDGEGRLKVNEYMQVEGYQNIFAVGDITNVEEIKTLYNARNHAELLARNLKASTTFSAKKWTKYKTPGTMMFVTLGRNDGLAHLPNGMIIPGFLVKMVKSKGVFLDNIHKSLGKPRGVVNIGTATAKSNK